MKYWIGAAALSGGLLVAFTASADVIFTNLDQPYGAYTATRLLGMEFVPSLSGTLQTIDMPIGIEGPFGPTPNGPTDVTIFLYSGRQTNLLETWQITVSNSINVKPLPLTTLISQTPVALIAGQEYWVFLLNPYSSANPGVFWAWDTTPSGTIYSSYGGGGNGYEDPGSPFDEQLGLRVSAAIPEPVTASVFGVGLAITFAFSRRKKIASDSAASAAYRLRQE